MEQWFLVLTLVLLGLGLIAAEVIFIPGATVAGLLGGLLALAGVYLAYRYFGNSVGHVVLGVSVLISIAAIYYGFNTETLDRFALHQVMEGKADGEKRVRLSVGDVGITRSVLRPSGNAEFFGHTCEVTTAGELIDVDEQVEVTALEAHKIYVRAVALNSKSGSA